MFEPEIILGPPGTGKTTQLLSIVQKALSEGTAPNDIGYLAFTRKAANEAITRACKQFNLTTRNFPYFRTLHSLAFKQLALKKNQVLGRKSLQEFGSLIGFQITGAIEFDEGRISGNLPGDRALFLCNMARLKCIDIKEQWRETPENLSWYEIELVFNGLEKFKEARGLLDFTDMLDQFINRAYMPELKLLVIDEAQDLSQMQWQMVETLAAKAKRTVVAGDDDQAIFRWAGADVNYFINLRGKATVLKQSYRVPEVIQDIADNIINNIGHRREKKWAARKAKGCMEYHSTIDGIDMAEGTWLVLARNEYRLQEAEDHCRKEGFIYSRRNRKSISEKTLNTIRKWEALRAGGECNATEARNILRLVDCKVQKYPEEGSFTLNNMRDTWDVLSKEIWHEAFTKMPLHDRVYLIAALRRGENPSKEPRIALNTIHGAKGGEAENVILYTDIAKRTYSEMRKNPEDEYRVFYVGVTRAKEMLYIITPHTKFFFSEL